MLVQLSLLSTVSLQPKSVNQFLERNYKLSLAPDQKRLMLKMGNL